MRARFVRKIHRFDSLDSTNTKARELIQEGAPAGTTVVATTQTAGRGRGDRKWLSPPGGLYFSTLLVPSSPTRAPELSILAGAAVAQAVRQILPNRLLVTLKWPNDVLVSGKKIAGILSESVGDETMGTCIVGVGINISATSEDLLPFLKNPFPATSLSVELEGAVFSADQVLDVTLTKLESLYELYWEKGFDFIREIWNENCRMIGKKVQIENSGFLGHNDKVAKSESGVFMGIDAMGAMRVRNESGQDQTFYSGEITCFWP
jgi:BirA family transcriptional regulator, biotin operon repressor / biotin---[acetyl-CoA-carboxylase] ligase